MFCDNNAKIFIGKKKQRNKAINRAVTKAIAAARFILLSDLKEYKNQVKSFNLWVFTEYKNQVKSFNLWVFTRILSTLFQEISIIIRNC